MKTKGLTIGHCVSHLGSAPTESKTDVLALILCDAATRQGPDAWAGGCGGLGVSPYLLLKLLFLARLHPT